MLDTTLIDEAIGRLERLQKTLTGREVEAEETPRASIPPERDPAEYIDEQLDRLLGALGQAPAQAAREPRWMPPVAAWEEEGGDIVIWMDIAGVARGSLEISFAPGQLVVAGRRGPPASGSAAGARARPIAVELSIGPFRRAIALPAGLSAERVSARVRDGMLELRLPRAVTPAVRSRTIPVCWEAAPAESSPPAPAAPVS